MERAARGLIYINQADLGFAIKTKYFWNTLLSSFAKHFLSHDRKWQKSNESRHAGHPVQYTKQIRQYYFEKIDKVNINVIFIPHG